MQLTNKKLKLVSITRQSLFDAQYVGSCDNCGKIIVNIATVQDTEGKTYEIGLDCKKALIDKPLISELLKDELFGSYNVKQFKKETTEAEKLLKYCTYPNIEIEIDQRCNDFIIRDKLPNKQFPQITGNIIYMQNLGYLFKIGLNPFIEKLHSTL